MAGCPPGAALPCPTRRRFAPSPGARRAPFPENRNAVSNRRSRCLSLLAGTVVFAVTLVIAGCGRNSGPSGSPLRAPASAALPLPFADVAAASGIDWETRSGRGLKTTILDTIGHGVAVVDYDGDDLPDLIFAGRDAVGAYRNRGEFRFERVDLGLRQPGHWGGAAVADVDNNGWPDLYLTGYGCAALYLNEAGRFREVTRPAGLEPPRWDYPAWGTSAGFADLDADGWVDLVVCYYLEFGPDLPQRCGTHRAGVTSVCPPKVYQTQRPRVYRNLGGKRFRDVTAAWGMNGHGGALGVAFQDSDGNGSTDVAVANDERPGDFFVNRGGRFDELGAVSNTAYDRQGRVHGGMGIDWGDVDNDLRPDLAVMTFTGEDKSLYRNLDGRIFEDVAWKWGLTGPMRSNIGFGTRFLDYDNDGGLDLVVANGHIQENAGEIRPEDTYRQPLRLFRNACGTLAAVGEGRWPSLVGRALATGDLDNDGGVDVVVTHLEGRAVLLRNVALRGHWLGLRFKGTRSNRTAIGARVEVKVAGAARRFEVHTAGSYMASNDPRLVIGLGEARAVDGITVRWPSGKTSALRVPAVDCWRDVREE